MTHAPTDPVRDLFKALACIPAVGFFAAWFLLLLCDVPWWSFALPILPAIPGLVLASRALKTFGQSPDRFAAYAVRGMLLAIVFLFGTATVSTAVSQYQRYGTLLFADCGGPRTRRPPGTAVAAVDAARHCSIAIDGDSSGAAQRPPLGRP